jgi:threonine aldolase
MANATAVKVHTNEGDEVIVEEKSHIYLMEMGHLAFIFFKGMQLLGWGGG